MNIQYNLPEDKFKIKTNIKPELVEDFMLDWVLRGQIGKGADHSKANNKDIYHIQVRCDLTYDHITISSDTGNKGLTAGILGRAVTIGALQQSQLEQSAQSRPKCTEPDCDQFGGRLGGTATLYFNH